MPVTMLLLFAALVIIIFVLVIVFIKLITQPQLIKKIEKMIKEGDYENAVKQLRKVIEKNNFDYEAHKLLGDAYLLKGEKKYAMMEYRIAGKNSENMSSKWESQIHRKLADLLYESGEFKEALSELLLLTKLDNRDSGAYYKIGQIYSHFVKYDQAIAYYRMAIKIDISFASAYFGLGMALYNMQNHRDALMEFVNTIKYDNKNFSSYYHMGLCHKNTGDLAKAIESFDIAERSEEFKARAILNKGICYIQMGNVDRAIDDLNKGLKIENLPKSIFQHMHYFIAEAHELKNDIVTAIEHWEIIFRLDQKFKDIAAKLKQYVDLRKSDGIKDYMTSSTREFQDICQNAIIKMGYHVHEIKSISNDEAIIIARESSKMVATKPVLKYISFSRTSATVDERRVRNAVDSMKKYNCNICVYVSTSNFSTAAKEFANTRPIDLIDAKRFTALLIA